MAIYAGKLPARILAAVEGAGEPLLSRQIAELIGDPIRSVQDTVCDLHKRGDLVSMKTASGFVYARPFRMLDMPPPVDRMTLVARI